MQQSLHIANEIRTQGISELNVFDESKALELASAVFALQPFDHSLFLTEAEWEESAKTHKHTNPGAENNILNGLQSYLDFVEHNEQFNELLSPIAGPDYRIYLKKLVCRLPHSNIPEWVHRIIGGRTANTLGAFIRPEFRTISYYYDVDVHQDIIEWPRQPANNKEHRLLYLYVHLGEVTLENSPLCFFLGSHRFGATHYQHDISLIENDRWRYRDPLQGKEMETTLRPLLGKAGSAALWHPSLLHGSHPVKNDSIRLALRYVLARDANADHVLLDEVNASIEGRLYIEEDNNPGKHANKDGSFNLADNDFTRIGRYGR